MKRVIAWVLFAGVVYMAILGARMFKNPWSVASVMPEPAIVHLLPATPAGCGSECTK